MVHRHMQAKHPNPQKGGKKVNSKLCMVVRACKNTYKLTMCSACKVYSLNNITPYMILNHRETERDWRDSSVFKSTCWFCRGSQFCSQAPMSGMSQAHITPFTGNMTSSGHCEHMGNEGIKSKKLTFMSLKRGNCYQQGNHRTLQCTAMTHMHFSSTHSLGQLTCVKRGPTKWRRQKSFPDGGRGRGRGKERITHILGFKDFFIFWTDKCVGKVFAMKPWGPEFEYLSLSKFQRFQACFPPCFLF